MKILSTRTVTPQGGILHRVQHASTSTQTDMIFGIFLPHVYQVGITTGPTPAICKCVQETEDRERKRVFWDKTNGWISSHNTRDSIFTILYVDWLSGLTCTDENFCQKAGPAAFANADALGMALIMPDTSPRGDGVANDDAYDLGQGAYV